MIQKLPTNLIFYILYKSILIPYVYISHYGRSSSIWILQKNFFRMFKFLNKSFFRNKLNEEHFIGEKKIYETPHTSVESKWKQHITTTQQH